MAGDWDSRNLSETIFKLFRSDLGSYYTLNLSFLSHLVPMTLFNHQGREQARKDISYHYDLGIELYGHVLDSNMNYSSGYWKNASNLEEAQQNKMDLIGRKLKLEKGETSVMIL